ncbi:MAG: hypothetical protein ACR2IE_15450 [Candidatus Sumerlaeaceae bacterium]
MVSSAAAQLQRSLCLAYHTVRPLVRARNAISPVLLLIVASAFAWPFADGSGESTDQACISANGRYVVFESESNNVTPGDTNGSRDIFRLDLQTDTIIRVNVSSTGAQSDSACSEPRVSADGNRVVFHSLSSNLVTSDTNNATDVFLRDITAATTTRVSVDSAGLQTANFADSYISSISSDGSRVAFHSAAANLVPGDTNFRVDAFLRNLTAGTTTRVSVDSLGTQADRDCYSATISGDGTRVAFVSDATNLVASDTNAKVDVFVRNVTAGTTVRASVSSGGAEANDTSVASSGDRPTLNTDGTRVAFTSSASNLVTSDTNGVDDVFVRDLALGTTVRASVTTTGSQAISGGNCGIISADGSRVVFTGAYNLLPGGGSSDPLQYFMRNLSDSSTTCVSVNSAGVPGNLFVGGAATGAGAGISADNNLVAFCSLASNMVANDTNGTYDIFVRNLAAGTTAGPSIPVTAADGWMLYR